MNRRGITALVAALLLSACAPSDAPPNHTADGRPWRGDVSYPGLPAIGVKFVVDGDDVRMIAAPNMGFDGGSLDGFVFDGDSARFSWSLNGEPYRCVLHVQPERTLFGPCMSEEAEPTFGMLMVPPFVDVPTGLARTMLQMSSVQWQALDTGTTTVWAAAGNRDRVLRDSVAAAISRARADNALLFGDIAHSQRVHVFFTGDREVLASVVGRPVGGWTDPMAATVALVGFGEHAVALRHELTHAISFNAWGPPGADEGWLREGLATWVAGACAGNGLHDIARDLRARGELVPLRAIVDEFQDQDDVIAYLQSASVVGYLIETHGLEAFRRVWIAGADGLPTTDPGVTHLERDWLRFLEAREQPRPIDWSTLRENGCG